MTNTAYEAADALGAAIAGLDADELRRLYADDIVVWHGASNNGLGKDENIGLLSALFAVVSKLEYQDIVRHEIEGGLVQQHRLTGTFDDGTAIPALNACMVIKVRDGKITRIDEYFDAATFGPVWTRLGV